MQHFALLHVTSNTSLDATLRTSQVTSNERECGIHFPSQNERECGTQAAPRDGYIGQTMVAQNLPCSGADDVYRNLTQVLQRM